ncbi:PREDICTED: myb-like protein X [Nelumbo nucifera]|uniref:Myb-like protein X n=2 Tax=Nelumbo nucifera TaxID=4432 RepID=A0A1U8B060_NELNU|nr:PREDICTED: myb-like protein X [Nelumbo nucifera]DAD37109.1 TPA_asm: hypothetical protein HUJ06_007750 [Nelumbo nucifera]
MSRCFPFPPPGYEKKARTDDADVLTKEKHKEKKHKKEKKDKEKKEGKEKKDKEKDKERSKDKHREKKDRKEKHKDKKDKEREKDKHKTLDDKRNEGRPEGHNAEKLGQNIQCAEEIKDSKFVQELDRRIRDEEKGTGNQMVENFTGTGHRKAEIMSRLVEKSMEYRVQGKEKNKDKKGDDRRTDGQRNKDEEKGMGNAMLQSSTRMDQRRVEEVVRPMEKDTEKRVEGKEKNKDKEGNDRRKDKHKEKDREKKSKGKNKEKEKEKEKGKDKNEHRLNEQDKSRESSKKDPVVTPNVKTLHLPKDNEKSAATDGNLKKRKDFEMNGFLHDNEIQPNKLPRPSSSSHPFPENGRKLETCRTAIQFSSDRQGAANNHKVDDKEHKVNGIIQDRPIPTFSAKPSFTTVKANGNGEAPAKPPHRDLKYLSQILTVPKMEEWSDFDDQEWLFSSDNLRLEKCKQQSSGVDETTQVWGEALQIESADVCALPYVIPY